MNTPDTTGQRVFSFDRDAMFDLRGTQTLSELFSVPQPMRDEGWLNRFLPAAWTASLEVGEPNVFQGPDFFRYIRLNLPQPGKPFPSNCVANLAQLTLDNAWGIAIFASADANEPEYVMPMGVVDSLVTYDSPQGDSLDLADSNGISTQAEMVTQDLQRVTLGQGESVFIGAPAANFLPAHTARALHFHLQQGWKIAEPRVSLLISPAMKPSRNFLLNRRLSNFPDASAASQQCHLLLWYLPPGRGVMLMPEGWDDSQMHPLTDYFSTDATSPVQPS